MTGKRLDGGTHALLAIDADRRVIEERMVDASEIAPLVEKLRERGGSTIRILIDGVALDARVMARCTGGRSEPAEPVQVIGARSPAGVDGADGPSGIEMAHAMLWDTYDRAARVQSWMLEQASGFTVELLENNKRLADQASELQKRHQAALAELDYMHREQKMMEGEAAAARLSRHLIEKAQAEVAAAKPPRSGADWFDELLDGAAVVFAAFCAPNGSRGRKVSN